MLSSTGQGIRLPASPFMPTDYINAALGAGFEIRSCAEVGWQDLPAGPGGPRLKPGAPKQPALRTLAPQRWMVLEVARR